MFFFISFSTRITHTHTKKSIVNLIKPPALSFRIFRTLHNSTEPTINGNADNSHRSTIRRMMYGGNFQKMLKTTATAHTVLYTVGKRLTG